MTYIPPVAESVNFFRAIRHGFERSFKPQGTASKSEFWYWMLFYVSVNIVLLLMRYAEFISTKQFYVLTLIFTIAILAPTISLWFRRGNDTKSLSKLPGLILTLSVISFLLQSIVIGTSLNDARIENMTPAERCANVSNSAGSMPQTAAWYNNLTPKEKCLAEVPEYVYNPEIRETKQSRLNLVLTFSNILNLASTALIFILGSANSMSRPVPAKKHN